MIDTSAHLLLDCSRHLKVQIVKVLLKKLRSANLFNQEGKAYVYVRVLPRDFVGPLDTASLFRLK